MSEESLKQLRNYESSNLIPNFNLGNCITNSYHLAAFVKNATKKYLVEGIALSENGKIFPHMWNRFVINRESKEYDVTHDLLMKGIPSFSYFKICENNVENYKNEIKISPLTTDIANLYWGLYPQSKPEK